MNKVKMTGRLRAFLYAPLWLILILIGMNAIVYFISRKAGIIMSVAILLYFILVIVMLQTRQRAVMHEMISFATQYGQVQKKLLADLDIPYAITDDHGKLLWFNNAFSDVTGKDRRNYRKSITSLLTGITLDKLPPREQMAEYDTVYDSRNYRVVIRNIVMDSLIESSGILEQAEGSGAYMYAFILHDETELRDYIRKYQDEAMVCGLIYLDNYDEALESVEEVRRSLLTALIDRKISKYFQDLDGLVRKFENDKYVLVMRRNTLEEIKNRRFDILEDVKTVNIGNDMSVTLSIGIGVNNGSYNRNMDCARMAIDLALGRGGDQVVLKDGDSISYYGGKTQAVEKSTRVKARVKAHALKEFIDSKEKVVVMGHKLIDVDAFGAAVGIYRASRTMGKKAYIVIDTPTSSTQPFIDMFRRDTEYDPRMFLNTHDAKDMVDDDTLLVVVDTSKPSYTGCEELLYQTRSIVVLDHHRQANEFIHDPVLSYIEPYASSACEMVAEILQYFTEGMKIRSIEADVMYAGIQVDTDNFIQKTGVRTFEAAAFLRRCGADVTRVRKMFREDVNDYRAKGETLKNAEMYRGQFIISVCPSDYIKSPTIVGAQAANQLLNIVGVRASFVLTEYKNVIYISARAIDEVNVQIIMERMGGGGHLNIAGCQLKCSIDEARDRLKSVIDEMLDGGEI